MRLWVTQNKGFTGALVLFALLYLVYNMLHPRGFSAAVLVQNANEITAIAFLAMAQTAPVIARGLDLSVGAVMTLCACIGSYLLQGSLGQSMLGIVVTLAAGAAFGLMNGIIIVQGRLQPIIATIATGAIAIGLSLLLRPQPGGDVDPDLSWALTNKLSSLAETYGWDGPWLDAIGPLAALPIPLVILFGTAALVWLPIKRTVTGRAIYAVGSAEGAAFASGLPIRRAKLLAYTLSGFFAGCAGVYLALQTASGNADTVQAGAYTLNSIAAVVLGGTSLMGGTGGLMASVVGAMILRYISFYFRILDIDPLLQPLIEGMVLLAAVSAGALRTLSVKNMLEHFR